MSLDLPDFDVAPFRLSGVVVAALLNHRPQWAALGEAPSLPPYKAPARAPVLAVRPRNTLARPGAQVQACAEGLSVGASLAAVIGRTACRVAPGAALDHVAGYTIAVDLAVPHGSHYRPAVRARARDGSCVIGPMVIPATSIPTPDGLAVEVRINGKVAQSTDTGDRVRGVAQLIADVTDFMTLQPGDLLLLGESAGAPLAQAGDSVEVTIEGIGTLPLSLVEAARRAA